MNTDVSNARAVQVEGLTRRFGARAALSEVDLAVETGELFVLLGPNGGGKSTLFQILATLLPPTSGRARIFGVDVVQRPDAVRALIGVVFQSPAIDRQLTVRENLQVQGRLYGLRGPALRKQADELLERLRLTDRARDRVGTLSGGLARRVEIAKGLLHRPRLFLLDEPSTGLDPAARGDLWDYLSQLRARDGVTILVTTHLMEEAERCDRLAILSAGRVVAQGAPAALKSEVGGDVVVITAPDPDRLRPDLERVTGLTAAVIDGTLRLETPRGHELVPRIASALGDRIAAISVGRPTLLDVFVRRTGHGYVEGGGTEPGAGRAA